MPRNANKRYLIMKGFVGIEEKVLFIKQKWMDWDEVPVLIVPTDGSCRSCNSL